MSHKATIINVCDITAVQREDMLSLMALHYAGVDPAVFRRDLDEKQWVIALIESDAERIVGFSTQVLLEVEGRDQPITALFSGDTIVKQSHRAHSKLARAWGRLVLGLIDAFPGRDLYWFLIAKGYKTYRFLPVFFEEFYPRFDEPTPVRVQAILDAVACRKFPQGYDHRTGIVHANGEDPCRLRDGVAEITAERLADPHVRFFASQNPGHARGDELCCLAPLTRGNLNRAAYRTIGPEPIDVLVMP